MSAAAEEDTKEMEGFALVIIITVESVYNSPVLSGHPLLSGQFSVPIFRSYKLCICYLH